MIQLKFIAVSLKVSPLEKQKYNFFKQNKSKGTRIWVAAILKYFLRKVIIKFVQEPETFDYKKLEKFGKMSENGSH